MTVSTFAKAVDSVSQLASPLLVGRRHRLRGHIKADLELLPLLHDNPEAHELLRSRITLDVARLCGVRLPGDKYYDVGTAIVGAVLTAVAGIGTYLLVRRGSGWWAVLTGAVTLLFFIATVSPAPVNATVADDSETGEGARRPKPLSTQRDVDAGTSEQSDGAE